MSYKATNWAYEMKITGPQKPVLVALADMADEDSSCYPGQERLSEMTGLSVPTVARALKRLEARGLLSRERRWTQYGYRTSDRYKLHLEVTVPETLTITEPTRRRAYKAECQSLTIRVSIPNHQSDRAIEPSVNHQKNHQGEPPLFCPKHPKGGPKCGPCGDAKRIHQKWLRDRETQDTVSGVITDPVCIHFLPPRQCPDCRAA